METYTSPSVSVRYSAGYRSFAVAITRIIACAISACRLKFGYGFPGHVYVLFVKGDKLSLASNIKARGISFFFGDDRQLNPPDSSGIMHVYGFLQVFGSLILNVRHASPELNHGIGEYFAYAVLPYVWDKLGRDAWPRPYDYFTEIIEQREFLLESLKEQSPAHDGDDADQWLHEFGFRMYAVSAYFIEMERAHGSGLVGAILARIADRNVSPEDLYTMIKQSTGESVSLLRYFSSWERILGLKSMDPSLMPWQHN